MDIDSALNADIIASRPWLFLGSRMKRLAEQMQTELSAFARRLDVPIQPGQYPVLALLDARGARTIGQLADSLGLSQPVVTKAVRRLREDGLVKVSRGESDGRQRLVRLSPAGAHVVDYSREVIWPLTEEVVRDLVCSASGPLPDQLAAIEGELAARRLSERASDKAPLLRAATEADFPAVVALMNQAYRGAGVEPGWSNEIGTIAGDRTSEAKLRSDLAETPEASLLIWPSPDGGERLIGCVWMEPEPDHVWYLGSLTVRPDLQNGGWGRRLLATAEHWAVMRGGRAIRMAVVNVRTPLIHWYERRGYTLTGETEPFPYGDDRFGTPLRPDLCFVVLSKPLLGEA